MRRRGPNRLSLGRTAYELRQAGHGWRGIAAQLGLDDWQQALTVATKFRRRHDLPGFRTMRPIRSEVR